MIFVDITQNTNHIRTDIYDLSDKVNKLEKFDNFYNHEIFMAELMAKHYNADNFYDDLQNIRLANKLSGININDKLLVPITNE